MHDYNLDFGYLAVSDLGDRLFLGEIETDSNSNIVGSLYRLAINELLKLQDVSCDIPFFTEKKLIEEMNLFDEWFLTKHLSIRPSKGVQRILKKTSIRF